MQYLILTGMSGAGKSTASRLLEDAGAFCVDNLPPMMLVPFLEACQTSKVRSETVVISVDVRGEEFFDPEAVSRLIVETRSLGYQISLVFIDATDDVLVSRYKETRREHPLASDSVSLTEAIATEREMLSPLKEIADFMIDTSALRARGLQRKLSAIVKNSTERVPLHVEVMSFGFKRGLPRQADLVYDVRFLPNPFYIEGLGRHTGLDEDVRHFVMDHPVTQTFVGKLTDMLDFLLPHYIEEGKHRLVIAIGCTGGAHRSVAISEATGAYLREKGYPVDINHRDLEIEKAHWNHSADEE